MNFTQNKSAINPTPSPNRSFRVYHIIWTSHSTTIVIVIMYVCNANDDEELTELNHCRSPLAAMQSCFWPPYPRWRASVSCSMSSPASSSAPLSSSIFCTKCSFFLATNSIDISNPSTNNPPSIATHHRSTSPTAWQTTTPGANTHWPTSSRHRLTSGKLNARSSAKRGRCQSGALTCRNRKRNRKKCPQ